MVVTVLFTKDSGEPATGLTLSDIDIYLWSVNKSTGSKAAVWSGENPTSEIGGGVYRRAYSAADTNTYEYYAYAHYTGGETLDVNYALQEEVVEASLDDILTRGMSNVEDAADATSLAALVLAAFESSVSGTTWTIRKTDGTTFTTKSLTVDSGANPITGVT
jgi:hypothetical protein